MIRGGLQSGPPMPKNLAPPPLSAADYEAIESAVMETARGRWFLAEYARRNRHADTDMLLGALARLENVVRQETVLPTPDRVRNGLLEMAKVIARTKAEIAAIKPDFAPGRLGEASEELDTIVRATESATSDILAAAEQIQEVAWTLREQGHKAETCELLDAQATEIYSACSFQDLTGQRIRKVIGALHYVESRINAMLETWGVGPSATDAAGPPTADENAALQNGAAHVAHRLDQADIVMGTAANDELRRQPPASAAVADANDRAAAAVEKLQAAPAPQPSGITAAHNVEPARERARLRTDPLAALRTMSYEERIALFS
jgi:chemotaxis protein CheZ